MSLSVSCLREMLGKLVPFYLSLSLLHTLLAGRLSSVLYGFLKVKFFLIVGPVIAISCVNCPCPASPFKKILPPPLGSGPMSFSFPLWSRVLGFRTPPVLTALFLYRSNCEFLCSVRTVERKASQRKWLNKNHFICS